MTNSLPFAAQEYAARLDKTRAAMQTAEIEVLLVSDPSNMAWLTGYDGWSFYVHQAVVVGLEGEPLWWGRGIDLNGARQTTYMAPDHLYAYTDDYVQTPERHPMEHLSGLIARNGWAASAIGVEKDNYYFSAAAFESLQHNLGGARFRDVTGLTNWCRAVKSPAEIALMRRAGQIVERMYERILERAEPGVRKNALVAEILHASALGTEEFGGDYPAIAPIVPTGIEASAAHLTWNDARLALGAATYFEIAGCHRRYHAPLCRTLYLGRPPRKMREAEAAVVEGLNEGIERARAGNRACDVADALYTALAKAGITKDGRCGYSIGLSYPPDWGERTISFRRSDQTVLESGMTFHFMPGIWMDDWGLAMTESLLIKETGPAECLAEVPRELFVKD